MIPDSNLGNLSSRVVVRGKCHQTVGLEHLREAAAYMFGISSTSSAILLAALAIALFAALLMIRRAQMPKKRPEKWEKAAIMKQLLAMSEREEYFAAKSTSTRARQRASRPGPRPSSAQLRTTAKATLASRSKTR
jgi:hypothetical protein